MIRFIHLLLATFLYAVASFVLTACVPPPLPPTIQTPTKLAQPTADNAPHLEVRIDSLWRMEQPNDLVVLVADIHEPLILSIELEPKVVEPPVLQKPVSIEGAPIHDTLHEVSGFQIVQRVDPGTREVKVGYPKMIFNSTLYPGGVTGWTLRIMLVREVIAYPVVEAKQLGTGLVITPTLLIEQPTLISGATGGALPAELAAYEVLVVPDSAYGQFVYVPLAGIMAALNLESGPSFDFEEATSTPRP